MPFLTICYHCEKSFEVPDSERGQLVRCPGCRGFTTANPPDDDARYEPPATETVEVPVATGVSPRQQILEDAQLASLTRMNTLKSLTIQSAPRLSDLGIKHLAEVTSLEELHIDQVPQMTDAGLAPLGALKNLKILRLTKTQVTEQACERLKAEIKHVTISR